MPPSHTHDFIFMYLPTFVSPSQPSINTSSRPLAHPPCLFLIFTAFFTLSLVYIHVLYVFFLSPSHSPCFIPTLSASFSPSLPPSSTLCIPFIILHNHSPSNPPSDHQSPFSLSLPPTHPPFLLLTISLTPQPLYTLPRCRPTESTLLSVDQPGFNCHALTTLSHQLSQQYLTTISPLSHHSL